MNRTRGGGLSGEGLLSVAGSKPKRVPVTMKSATVEMFLQELADTKGVESAYEPYKDHTDDYPRNEIVVQVPPRAPGERGGVALLFTESQGDFHAPRAVSVRGKVYVAPGDKIGRALRALDRPLKKSVLRRMTR